MPQVNEAKLTEMVEAISKQLEFMWDIVDRELEEERLRKTLTPFCMEMTDQEISQKVEKLYDPDIHTKFIRGAVERGAKFYRDR